MQEGDRDEDGIGIPANGLTTGGGTIRAADGTVDVDLALAAETPGTASRWTAAERDDTGARGRCVVDPSRRSVLWSHTELLVVAYRGPGGAGE